MKLWVFCCLVAAAAARPGRRRDGDLDFYENRNDGTGNFSYGFKEAGPHSPKVKVQGELKKLSESEEALVIKGSYEYYIEDNINKHGPSYTLVKVKYVADEKGYHPHIIFLPGAIQLLSQAVDPRVFATLLGSG